MKRNKINLKTHHFFGGGGASFRLSRFYNIPTFNDLLFFHKINIKSILFVLLQQFGEIEEAVVITDRQTAKSKGYGFVTMVDKAGAERACEDPNPIIDGRKANVNLAYLGAKPRGIVGADAGLPLLLAGGYPGLMQGAQFGLPQYVYPSAAYLAAAQAATSPTAAGIPLRVPPHLPLSLSAASPHLAEHPATSAALSPAAAATAAVAASRLPAGYETAYPYMTAGAYGLPGATAAYTYAGVPAQQLSQLAAYQQQQALQDQLQWDTHTP